jgi:hypothetical protein
MKKTNKSMITMPLELIMYRKKGNQLPLENFHLPFDGLEIFLQYPIQFEYNNNLVAE